MLLLWHRWRRKVLWSFVCGLQDIGRCNHATLFPRLSFSLERNMNESMKLKKIIYKMKCDVINFHFLLHSTYMLLLWHGWREVYWSIGSTLPVCAHSEPLILKTLDYHHTGWKDLCSWTNTNTLTLTKIPTSDVGGCSETCMRKDRLFKYRQLLILRSPDSHCEFSYSQPPCSVSLESPVQPVKQKCWDILSCSVLQLKDFTLASWCWLICFFFETERPHSVWMCMAV